MAARSIDCCDGLVSLVSGTAGLSQTDGSAIQRAYAAIIGVNLDNPSTFIWGRQVWIFPATESAGEMDRSEISHDYDVGIVIAEMWLTTPATFAGGVLVTPGVVGGPGMPPRPWIDQRVSWVESAFDALATPGQKIQGERGEYFRLPDMPAKIVSIYDRDDLLERKLFVSELQLTYRDLTGLTGV